MVFTPPMKHESFLKAFSSCQGALRAYLLAATRDVHQADDLLQEVSLVLWAKFDDYDGNRPFIAWAIGIAKFKILHWRRTDAAAKTAFSTATLELLSETAVEEAQELGATQGHLAFCLEKLHEPIRRLLKLKYWENQTIAQIAGDLSRSSEAVAMMLVRARQSLRQCIQRRIDQEAQ